MPRSIITDNVIESLCPEYQPLGFPNAYFDNVGGFYKSDGIKPTPIRPPPRPARIQYLSSNANIPLEKVRADVDTSQEIAQPVIQRITATAPPFEPSMLAGTPPPYSTGVAPPTYEEGVAIGIPPPIFEEVLEEKEMLEEKAEIPMFQPLAVGRTTIEGEPSFAPELPPKHIIDHTTPIEQGVEIKRAQAERMTMLGEETLSRMREKEEIQREELEKLAPEIASEELRLQALEETVRLAEQLPREAEQLARIGISRAEQQRREGSLFEEAERQIASVTQQRVQAKQRAEQQLTQGILARGTERVAKQRLEVASAVENVGVSGIQQPPREEQIRAQKELGRMGMEAVYRTTATKKRMGIEEIEGDPEKVFQEKFEEQRQMKFRSRRKGIQERETAKKERLEREAQFLEEAKKERAQRERSAELRAYQEEAVRRQRVKRRTKLGIKAEDVFVAPQELLEQTQTPEFQAIKETMKGKQRLRGAQKAELYNPFRTELR